MTWFRLHDDLLNDPKVQKLPSAVFKALINLWCIASKNDGVIPEDDLAYQLRMRPCSVAATLELLLNLTLLEREGNTLTPHNWRGRQFISDSSTARTRAYRERERHRNVTVTPPDTDTDTEQRQIHKKKRASRKTITTTMTGEFELWWSEYPHKVGKRDAMTAFANACLRGATLDALLSGVREYRSAKPPDRQWCNPATWLNQDRYLDQPAPAVQPVQKVSRTREAAMRIMERIREEDGTNVVDLSRPRICGQDGNHAGVELPAAAAGTGDVHEPAHHPLYRQVAGAAGEDA